MWQSHTPAWLLALAAPLLLPGWLTGLLLALAIVNVACYLPYVVFNDWWYLRFMLPAIAMLLVLMVATLDSIAARAFLARGPGLSQTQRVRAAVLCVSTVAMCFFFIREARARSVFDLQRLESRYERAGLYVARVVFRQTRSSSRAGRAAASASIRIAGRSCGTRSIPRGSIARSRTAARAASSPTCCSSAGKSRCSASGLPAAPSRRSTGRRPRRSPGQVRIYRPEDRDRYLKGEGAPTEIREGSPRYRRHPSRNALVSG